MDKLIYRASMFLKSGHPAYKQAWLDFMATIPNYEPPLADMAAMAGITQSEVNRHIIRSLNGLHPHATSRPRRLSNA